MEDEIDEAEIEKTKAALHDKDTDPRLERLFKNYINSQGIKGAHVNSIYTDLCDGLVLLRVLDKVEPGCVTWKKVRKKPKNIFEVAVNCNECIIIGKKQLGFGLINCKAESL